MITCFAGQIKIDSVLEKERTGAMAAFMIFISRVLLYALFSFAKAKGKLSCNRWMKSTSCDASTYTHKCPWIFVLCSFYVQYAKHSTPKEERRKKNTNDSNNNTEPKKERKKTKTQKHKITTSNQIQSANEKRNENLTGHTHTHSHASLFQMFRDVSFPTFSFFH